MNTELHSKAIKKIEDKIKGSLLNCLIKDSWPQYESFSIHVESLGKEILKHKKEWLDISDVFSIFHDFVYGAIKDKTKPGEKLQENLWDILGENKGLNLKESIKNFIISIPRPYDIYTPITIVSEGIPTNIQLCKNMSLIVFEDVEQIPGGYPEDYLSKKLEFNKAYFKQRLTGYCGNRLLNLTIKKAVSNFKILLQQGVSRHLFKIAPEQKAASNFLLGFTHHQVPKASVISVDQISESPKLLSTELPVDFSQLLNKIDFYWEDDLLIRAKKSGRIEQAIAAILKKAIELIECETEEAMRVKSAIEWCFDSYTVENQTLAFLQVCIGLEALLGDDGYSGALTETLADRCSYLISDDIKGRKTIKKGFKELYTVRSKLVHGSQTELSSNQNWYLKWGRVILEHAILKEIKHLNLEKI